MLSASVFERASACIEPLHDTALMEEQTLVACRQACLKLNLHREPRSQGLEEMFLNNGSLKQEKQTSLLRGCRIAQAVVVGFN